MTVQQITPTHGLAPEQFGGALLPGEGALVSGFLHEKIWFGEPAADAKLPDPAPQDGPAPTAEEQAEAKQSLYRIRKALGDTITTEAPRHGWSPDEARQIAAQAELIFFKALERGADAVAGMHMAIALAQRAHAAWQIMSAKDNGKDPAKVFEEIVSKKSDSDDPKNAEKVEAARKAFTAACERGAPLEAAFYRALDASATVGAQ